MAEPLHHGDQRPPRRAARRFMFGLLVAVVLLVAWTLWHLLGALFLGAVLAILLWPLQRFLTRKLRNRPTLAAVFLTGGVTLALLVPIVGFSAFFVSQAVDGYGFVVKTLQGHGTAGLLQQLPAPFQGAGRAALESLPKDGAALGDSAKQLLSGANSGASAALGALSATGALLFGAAMTLIATFFCLLQGNQLLSWIERMTPVPRSQLRELFQEFEKVSRSVIYSTLLTSTVQAMAALVGYLIARLPHPLFFTALTFFFACIPVVGAGSVCVLAALLLLVTGHMYMALFLTLWGVVFVGLSDNVVKPLLMRNDGGLDGAVIFFALIGGIASFGAIGLLAGPLSVSLFVALVRIYRRAYVPGTAGRDAKHASAQSLGA